MVNININIQKKDLFIITAIAVFLVGCGVVIAYNSNPQGNHASVMGHSVDEIDWSQPISSNIGVKASPSCPAGSNWNCGVHTLDVWADSSSRANSFCIGGGVGTANPGTCIYTWNDVLARGTIHFTTSGCHLADCSGGSEGCKDGTSQCGSDEISMGLKNWADNYGSTNQAVCCKLTITIS
jgi:hypothetical protein